MTCHPWYGVWNVDDVGPGAGESSSRWRWVRLAGAAAVLGILVWRLGSGPFVTGVESISLDTVAATVLIALVTTVCSAWRWCTIARGLNVGIPLRRAVPAYYRSQFLNAFLPGGVLGDVHRGVRYGRVTDDVGGGLRAVAWERSAGQVVQGTITAVALIAYSSPVPTRVPEVMLAVLAVALGCLAVVGRLLPRGPSVPARVLRTLHADLRDGLLPRRAWPIVVLTSTVVFGGHIAILVIATRAVGVTTPLHTVVPLAMVVLLAASVPLNIAGWGLREGAAAWAFAAAGLGAGQGIAAATAFGVLTLAATLPGVVVLAGSALRHHSAGGPAADRERPDTGPENETAPVGVRREEVMRG